MNTITDADRLAFLYSNKKTTSNALVDLEIRHFNHEEITLDEVREAIDECVKHSYEEK